ncbi:hypothetical protein B0T18DRAFT_436764 [Schizothecium vesticola]|uniref:Amidoligase enzyme n=1 Tax=Schizothecium vesticola TaxID=314040 RepID=A0AA40F0W5_9PEZI|nr:hypothetical protein B0T18DRAFT_436764 [Schizothecium vesticola]
MLELYDSAFQSLGAYSLGKNDPCPPDTAQDLALAVELKFLLPLLIQGKSDPTPKDPRPVQVIPKHQKDGKAPLILAHESIARTIRSVHLLATTTDTISSRGLSEPNFWNSHWIVKRAGSAEARDDDKGTGGSLRESYLWVPVEISSPKMRARDPATDMKIKRVLQALTTNHRLAANYTCEVHVHLGRMDGRPLTLPTLQRLASLLWAAEPTLRSIRNPASPNYHNVFTWGSEMRRFSRLALDLASVVPDSNPEPSIAQQDHEALDRIWGASSYLDLGRLLSGPTKQYRRLGFNFSSFGLEDDRAHRSPRTVEFRMMEGTTQGDLIHSWVRICASVCEAAIEGTEDRFCRALGRLLHHDDDDEAREKPETPGAERARAFRELMQDLGVPRSVSSGFEVKVRQDWDDFQPASEGRIA